MRACLVDIFLFSDDFGGDRMVCFLLDVRKQKENESKVQMS